MYTNKLKEIWTKICVAAIGINIAIIICGLIYTRYDIIPLAIINALLLSTIFLKPGDS